MSHPGNAARRGRGFRILAAPALISLVFAVASADASPMQVVGPLPPGPLPTTPPAYLQYPSGPIVNAAVFQQSDRLSIAGSRTASSVSFGYQLGTSATSNPYIFLDFSGSGPVTYDFNFAFDVQHVGPESVIAGQRVTLTPYLGGLSGTPSLTASQNITFDTSLNFGFDFLGLEVDEELDLPDTFSIDAFSATLGGSTSLTTSGVNVVTAPSATCPGCFVAETNQNSADAWRAGIDLLEVADDFALPLEAVDALFDLELALGMPIYRRDLFGLSSYDFSVANGTVCQGVAVGEFCDYEFAIDFSYSLFASSIFAFGTDLTLDFIGPFGIDEEIFRLSGDPFGVGRVNTFFSPQTTSFTLRGRSLVTAEPEGCTLISGNLACFSDGVQRRLSDLDLGAYTNPALLGPQVAPDFGGNGRDIFISVPEPGTTSLLLAAVLALAPGLTRRRRSR